MGNQQTYLIKQIVKYSQKLDRKGFGANHDGNISVKYGEFLLATPTAVNKGNVVDDMVITLDMTGKKIAGIGKPFSEIQLHLAAYEERPEAVAVVHAHPLFASALGLAGLPLMPQIPEAVISIGDCIPVTNFAMPGSAESIAEVKSALRQADVFLLPGNGTLAIGDSVEQAYLRLELVEHVAKTQFYAQQMGLMQRLSAENSNKLMEKRASIGLGPKNSFLNINKIAENNSGFLADTIKDIIAAEIRKLI